MFLHRRLTTIRIQEEPITGTEDEIEIKDSRTESSRASGDPPTKILHVCSFIPFCSSPPHHPHRVLQWTTFIERTFCTENEPDRYVGREEGERGELV